jgi:hypothetical protein
MNRWPLFEVEPALVPTRDLGELESLPDFLSAIAPDINDDAPARLERLAPRMTDPDYWAHLAALWVYTDAPHQHLRVWRRLFRASRPGRHHLMHLDELETLRDLPAQVTLHRGFSRYGGERGIAWTPDPNLALAFAERWLGYAPVPDDGVFVATITVPRAKVIACFERESMEGVECIVLDRRGHRCTVSRHPVSASLANLT